MLCCSGSPEGSSWWCSAWIFSRCPWRVHARALPSPYVLTSSPPFVLHVSLVCWHGSTKNNYRLFSACFPCEELNATWRYIWLPAGEASVRSLSFSSLSAQHFCTQAGSITAWPLASLQDGNSNKIYRYFVIESRISLWTSSGMLTTELYWHSVETVGKGNIEVIWNGE